MRTAGFPCRSVGCDQVFPVLDQNSMDALRIASAARTTHELGTHDYHHVQLSTEAWPRPYQRTNKTPVLPGSGRERS
jgi:hypothetical protein